ncbi:DNA-directed RNA polymerase I subunit RPA43 [Anthophora quadrimaculata]
MKFKAYTGITWSVLELTGALEDEDSQVHFEKCRKHLGLHPFHLTNLNAALNEILSSNLYSYDNDLKGFLLAYKNPKLLTPLGEIFYDTCFIHVDIEAEFYVFRPKVGCTLKGIVNKKGLDHIGVLVHKAFNVSIPKPDEEENWPGDNLEIGQEAKFKITFLDFTGKLPFIRGVLNSVDYLHGCRLTETSINNRRLSFSDNVQNNVENSVNKISEKSSKHVKGHAFHAIDSESTSNEDIPQIKKKYVQQKSKKKFKQEKFIEVNEEAKEDKKRTKRSKEIKDFKLEIAKVENTDEQYVNNVSVNDEYENNEELEKSIVSKKKTKKKFKTQSSQSSIDEDNESYVEHSPKKMLKKVATLDSKSDIKVEQLVANSDIEQGTEEGTSGNKDKTKKKSSKRKILDDSDNSTANCSIENSKSSSKKSSKKNKTSPLEIKETVNFKTEELNGVDINETNNEIRESPKKRHKERKHSVNIDISESEVDRSIKEMSVTKCSTKANISDFEFMSPNTKIKKEKTTSSDNTEDENAVQTIKTLIKKDPESNSFNDNYDIKVEDENNTIKKKRKKHSKDDVIDTRKIKVEPEFRNVVIKTERPDYEIVSENIHLEEDTKHSLNINSPKKKSKANLDKSISNDEENIKSPKKPLKNKAVEEMHGVKIKTEEFMISDESNNYNSHISSQSNEKLKKGNKSSSNMQLNNFFNCENNVDIETNFEFWNDTVKTERFTDS